MDRFSRKKRTDIETSNSKNDLFDIIDDSIKHIWRINDDEYDYLCEVLTDDELNLFCLVDEVSISKLKFIIKRVNELVFEYQNRDKI